MASRSSFKNGFVGRSCETPVDLAKAGICQRIGLRDGACYAVDADRDPNLLRIEIVNFYQPNARCVVCSTDDGRVIPRTQRRQDGGFERIGWR